MEDKIEFNVGTGALGGFLDTVRFTVGPYYWSDACVRPKNYFEAEGFLLYGQSARDPVPLPVTIQALRLHNGRVYPRQEDIRNSDLVWLHQTCLIQAETIPPSADNLTFLANFLKCRAKKEYEVKTVWLMGQIIKTEHEYIVSLVIEHKRAIDTYPNSVDRPLTDSSIDLETSIKMLEESTLAYRGLCDFLTILQIRGRDDMLHPNRFISLEDVRKGKGFRD